MKVVIVNTWDETGGAAIACKRLAKALRNAKVDAQILVLKKTGTDSFVSEVSKLKSWQGKINLYLEKALFYFKEKNQDVRFAFSSPQFGIDISNNSLIKSADIIHLHWTCFGFLSHQSIQYLFELKKPIFITQHDMWYFTGGCHHSGECENYISKCGNCETYLKNPSENDISRNFWELKNTAFSSNPNLTLISCSNWLRNRSAESQMFAKFRNVAIPNPIDTELFKPLDRTLLLEKYGLDTNKKYLLTVAAKLEVYWKGFSYLIEMVNSLKHANYCLLIVGQINEETAAQILIDKKVLGTVTSEQTMCEIYNLADVLVTSSLFENLPNTIMEAMACGVPCVAFETGGIPEMIQHKQNGYLAPLKNTNELKKGVEWVIENQESLKPNARNFAVENYDQKIIADKVIELYHQTLANI